MTKKIGRVLVLAPEPPGKCQLCGKKAETRPYGPKGENVCFECGMKDEPAAMRAFERRLAGPETTN